MQRGEEYEREAVRRLPALLEEGWGLAPGSVAVDRQPRRQGPAPDLLIRLDAGPALVAEVKSSARSVDVEQATRQAQRAALELGAVPVVVVPYMGEIGRRVAREAGVGWIDLSGNANLRVGDRVLHVEGKPNRFKQRGRPSSPFAPVSARVARLLLLDPSEWWRQADLAREADMGDGQVSKVVSRLAEMELVERRADRAVRPGNPDLILDAWAEDYDFLKHEIVHGHVSGSGAELARGLARRLDEADIGHALTGLPGAWLRDRFAQFRLVSVYLDEDPVAVAEEVGARLERRGANVQFVLPKDSGVFAGAEEVDGTRCVSAVQNYLDLLGLPERADEAAAHLRAEHLNWAGDGS